MGAGRLEKPSLHQRGCGAYRSYRGMIESDSRLDLKFGDQRDGRKEEENIYFASFDLGK